jgi:hypothetical protein
MADVVPLRVRSAPKFSGPPETFVDPANPARTLRVAWSPDQQAVQLSIEAPGVAPAALVLDSDEVLDLVRVLVEHLPRPAADPCRPPGTVLRWTPRPRGD